MCDIGFGGGSGEGWRGWRCDNIRLVTRDLSPANPVDNLYLSIEKYETGVKVKSVVLWNTVIANKIFSGL